MGAALLSNSVTDEQRHLRTDCKSIFSIDITALVYIFSMILNYVMYYLHVAF